MDLAQVRALAVDLMAEHGLRGWSFTFDRAVRRAGVCRFHTQTISVSRHLMSLYDEPLVRDTLLHEIAHALVGPGAGHGPRWRATALQLGCSGERLVAPGAPRPGAPWVGTCPAGHTVDRFRQPRAPSSCHRCKTTFDPRYLLSWSRRDEAAAASEAPSAGAAASATSARA